MVAKMLIPSTQCINEMDEAPGPKQVSMLTMGENHMIQVYCRVEMITTAVMIETCPMALREETVEVCLVEVADEG